MMKIQSNYTGKYEQLGLQVCSGKVERQFLVVVFWIHSIHLFINSFIDTVNTYYVLGPMLGLGEEEDEQEGEKCCGDLPSAMCLVPSSRFSLLIITTACKVGIFNLWWRKRPRDVK